MDNAACVHCRPDRRGRYRCDTCDLATWDVEPLRRAHDSRIAHLAATVPDLLARLAPHLGEVQP